MARFVAPIPGQSLTQEPKNAPWERSPEISDPEKALQMHINRLNKPKIMESVLQTLMLDIDVKTLTEGILRGAVANGVHSIDVGLIIAPVIHEFIVDSAKEAGIDYDEGLEDTEELRRADEAFEKALLEKTIEKEGLEEAPEEDGFDMGEEPLVEEVPEEMPEEEKPRGLMSRG